MRSQPKYPGQCSEPIQGWREPSDGYGALALINRVKVTGKDEVLWNGKAIGLRELANYSSIVPTMNPVPFTILEIENGASCSTVQEVRKTIDKRAQCRSEYGSKCGEGAGPWATISDVIGPKGEIYKYYPDGRSEIIPPTKSQQDAFNSIQNEVDAAVEAAQNASER